MNFGSAKKVAPRASACSPVACAIPLAQGGYPPPNGNQYSHAFPPTRQDATLSIDSSRPWSLLRLQSSGRSSHSLQSPFALPKFPSGCIWSP